MTIRCPKCGRESTEGYSFCPDCGSKLTTEQTTSRPSIAEEIQGLLNKGWECEQQKLYKDAEFYYNSALRLDPNIPSARAALSRVMNYVMDYNLTINVYSEEYQPGQAIDVSVFGVRYTIQVGGSMRFKMPVGTHKIGISRYSRNILISDSSTRVTVNFVLAGVNRLDIQYGR